MGWFSGNAEDLMPLPRHMKSSHFVKLMGGVDKVLEAAKLALNKAETDFKVSQKAQRELHKYTTCR